MAKDGHALALRLVLERIVPRRRSRPVMFDLPLMEKAADISSATLAVLQECAVGELTIDEAVAFMGLIEHHRRALETADLAVRLELLEEGSRK